MTIHRQISINIGKITAILIALLFLPLTKSHSADINEVLYNPIANDGTTGDNGEFIELSGTPGESIACFYISDGDWAIKLPDDAVINAMGYFVIGYGDAEIGGGSLDFNLDTADNTDSGGYLDGSSLTLTNGGEFVVLFDETGTLVDGIQYGSPSSGNDVDNNNNTFFGGVVDLSTVAETDINTVGGGAGNGESIGRDPNNGQLWGNHGDFNVNGDIVSAGAANNVPEPSSTSLLILGLLSLIMRRRK